MGFGVVSKRWFSAGVIVACAAGSAQADDAPAGALHLVVQPVRRRVAVGETLPVTIRLRNQADAAAPAPKALVIDLSAKFARLTPPLAEIPVGSTHATVEVVPEREGILEIRAAHPEVLSASGFVLVGTPLPAPTAPVKKADPKPAVKEAPAKPAAKSPPPAPSGAVRLPTMPSGGKRPSSDLDLDAAVQPGTGSG